MPDIQDKKIKNEFEICSINDFNNEPTNENNFKQTK